MISIKAVFSGQISLLETRGDAEPIEGAIDMAFMIAPTTLSASILTDSSLIRNTTVLAIAIAVLGSLVSLILIKIIHDPLKK